MSITEKIVLSSGYLLSALTKNGISSTMEKILLDISFTATSKLKLLLNIFSYLGKNSKYGVSISLTYVVRIRIATYSLLST